MGEASRVGIELQMTNVKYCLEKVLNDTQRNRGIDKKLGIALKMK